MRRLSLIGLVFTTAIAAQKPAPRLAVSASATTVATFDTLGGILATPRTLDGKVAATSPVKWAVTPSGLAVVIPLDGVGHTIALAGLSAGSVHLVATWRSFPGTAHIANGVPVLDVVTLQDSLIITVTGPRLTLSPFNVVVQGVSYFDPTIPSYCLFATATDKSGKVYPGLPAGWSTSDTALTRQLNSAPCSAVTVDPKALTALPRPPQ